MLRLLLTLLVAGAAPAHAQDGDSPRPGRAPLTVALPPDDAALLRIGSTLPLERYATVFDRLAAGGAIPVLGPGVTLAIRAAADRARVFLAWTQYDLDGDGQVARREFDQHAEMSWGDSLGDAEYALLEAEWAAADGDANGVVTLDEIHALALAVAPVPAPDPLGPEGEAILLMDLDNDGFVSWDEVEAVLRSRLP